MKKILNKDTYNEITLRVFLLQHLKYAMITYEDFINSDMDKDNFKSLCEVDGEVKYCYYKDDVVVIEDEGNGLRYDIYVKYSESYLKLLYAIKTQDDTYVSNSLKGGTFSILMPVGHKYKHMLRKFDNKTILKYMADNPKYYTDWLPGVNKVLVCLMRRPCYLSALHKANDASLRLNVRIDMAMKLRSYISSTVDFSSVE